MSLREVFKTKSSNLCIVMEYCDGRLTWYVGGDLKSKIKEFKDWQEFIPEETVITYFAEICLALKHAHDRKILHWDIKS